jgi:toxin CcdB
MQQFCAYRNRNAATRRRYPLLLVVQSDLIADTGTRVVVPMAPMSTPRHPPVITGLTPVVDVDGVPHILLVPMLAAVELADLGPLHADLAGARATIMAALDLLVSGI